MKIYKKYNESTGYFDATLVCEHCESTQEEIGFKHYSMHHDKKLPLIKCGMCGKDGSEDYVPMTTKYHKDQIV